MTDIEKLLIHIENVRLFLASAECALKAGMGLEAAKISAASIAFGAAHSSVNDIMDILSTHKGSALATSARIDAMKCVSEGVCSCGRVHSLDDDVHIETAAEPDSP